MIDRFYIGQVQVIPQSEEERVLQTLNNVLIPKVDVLLEIPIDEWERALSDFGVLQ